jgi:CHASE3 domain sensor protein
MRRPKGMKAAPRFFSTRQLVIAGLSVPILLLIVAGWLQWRSLDDFRAARERVATSHAVQRHLDAFLSSMKDAETGQRGYLLTHLDDYLKPYHNALVVAPQELQALKGLTADNPEQWKNLLRLGAIMSDKFGEIGQTISLVRRGDAEAAIRLVRMGTGQRIMEEIRETAAQMHEVERQLYLQREEAYQREIVFNSRLSFLLVVLGLVFIAAIFLLLRRLERLQSIITICAWSHMIQYEGEWLSIEDYLKRRFKVSISHGISTAEAQKLLQNIRKNRAEEDAERL